MRMNQPVVLLLGLAAFAVSTSASAQVGASAPSPKCGAYAYAGNGAWGAARGYPDCEAAKKAAIGACQKRALQKAERDDCLVGPIVGPGLWFQGSWCRNSQAQRMMTAASDPNRGNLDARTRKDASDRGYDPNTCQSLVIYHADDARKVTSGRGY